MLTKEERREKALEVRRMANELAHNRPYVDENHAEYQPVMHRANGDENIPLKPLSYTKGLRHDEHSGLLVNEADFVAFVKGIDSGNPEDFRNTPLGPTGHTQQSGRKPKQNDWLSERGKNTNSVRAWESAGAGLTFDLEGPDAQAVTMPPAPGLSNQKTPELTAEIGEIYAQALLRDIPFSVYYEDAKSPDRFERDAQEVVDALNKLVFFENCNRNNAQLNLENVFRGKTEGDLQGPYISQFLLAGNNGVNQKDDNRPEYEASDGIISYGSQSISQKVREASKNRNYMTNWKEWLDVQHAANFGGQESYRANDRRFITTPRDMATFVHYDALYQAYLNACLLLLGAKAPFDPGVPFQQTDIEDHQQGFAHYGGPHILTLVTEVATRALKAVRYQKFNVHRRLRPEALAARFEKLTEVKEQLKNNGADNIAEQFQTMSDELENCGIFNLLKNANENEGNLLLPMAFAEGSPMHPSYGAGHATVAGACVTILKAFFDHDCFIKISQDGETFSISKDAASCNYAFVPNRSGNKLKTVETTPLTVLGELNKLAANISIGRNWAGVHYYSDYTESLRLGEEIAIGILQEQSFTYNPYEDFNMTLVKFDGETIKIPHPMR